MRERIVQREILAAYGAHPRIRLDRINTGVGWFSSVTGLPCRKTDPRARPVRFNPKGTADLVGLIAPTGRMLQIECKSATGTQRPEQKVMQRVVTAFGGLYIVARVLADVDEALSAIGIFR